MSSERAWSFGDSMEEAVQAAGSPVELMRDLGVGRFTKVRDEFTHWIEEQRSWRETCAFADQSYHMTDHHVQGPDAIELYKKYAVNSFENAEPGKAKQMVVANPNGYFIGDAILFHLDDDEFLSVGGAAAHNWLQYQVESGDLDVEGELRGRPVATKEDPKYFRYQVQGPEAIKIMEEAVDEPLPDLGFFNFESVSIGGVDANLLRHGMAGEPGFEFWGSYDQGDDVKETVLEAGEEYGIKRLGGESYQTPNAILGWVPLVVPAIFDEGMEEYREWLDVRRGLLSIGGSFDSDDITDYYFTPIELNYDHILNFDHDFVGKEPLEEEYEDPAREKVTLVWDGDDVVDTFASLFREGDTYQFMDFPHPRAAACPYDEVQKDGEHVGVSTDKSYIYNEREFLSLAVIDADHAEPGTEVTLIWGEPEDNENPNVERHVQKEISATVANAPYSEDKR
ncbi:aminomethyl transferase family protein [Halobium palmae]|uniref:Aminomethyl transferase family protein n=1 Tax=Halobium palmae TaxID=1776492 RepID=A0ABD5RX90_9EURY